MAAANTTPRMIPATPPATLIITASVRNCALISPCVAPMARRTPISLMRSRMDASMMFMIPIPPTTSEIDAMAPRTMLKIDLVVAPACSSSSGTLISKSVTSLCRRCEHPAHDFGDGGDVRGAGDLHDHLVQLVVVLLLRALVLRLRRVDAVVLLGRDLDVALRHLAPVAEPQQHRGQRDVHVHLRRRGCRAASRIHSTPSGPRARRRW